ncbi:MAG: ribonuclease D [Desulfobacteraceae bacterium]|nr:ribonuclease D [Desulfobacteraceae bacterium]
MSPSDYELIDTSAQLTAFARHARQASLVAVDLEADSMFHYREKVCLLQMAANGRTVVIDPLVVTDLSALKPVFESDTICKIFHGADYDVRSLYRDYGIAIQNLFDTQLAGMYLGYGETSLESMVGLHFGVELDKKYQKKDWSQRPLPPEMVAYAASDVRYLIPLTQILTEELQAKQRLAWVQEGCRYLSQVRPPENHCPLYLKFRGAGRLAPSQLGVLEALLQLRDAIARQKDRPLFKIIGNSTVLKIAVEAPSDLSELKAGQALSAKQLDMYGQAIVAAIQKARQIPAAELPKYPRHRAPRLSPRIPKRVKALRDWRDRVAASLGLDPALLFNKSMIMEIATRKPRSLQELSQVPQIHQWQVEAFGEAVLEIIKPLS